jgi:peroxiredoxin-like protein
MTDLVFDATVWWTGCGRDGAGGVSTGGQEFEYSAPLSMGGRGIGTSPEELLVSAVASCYAGTLYHLLARDGLAADQVSVRAEGSVSDYPSRRASFSRIVVHPTFSGADPSREAEYGRCARTAREHCFIGKALRSDIRYEVGDVVVQPPAHVHVEVE